MKFVVYSRHRAGSEAPDEPHITISITDPHSEEATLFETSQRRDVLRLSFTDMEERLGIVAGDVPFRPDHAEMILWFVGQWRQEVNCIVVHCEAGASRSPAVAAALCVLLGGDDAPFFASFHPNRYVRRELLEFARKSFWPRGDKFIGETIQPVEPITLGRSENSVARFVTEQGSFIRKAGKPEALAREAEVLTALDGVFPLAPRWIGRDGEAFFQEALPGVPLSDAIHEGPEKIARLFGEALRAVHELTPPLAPDPNESGPPVFSHGDWCLPNVLIDGGRISGIVDWSDGGWRDARIDLGTGIWTLHYNLGGPHPPAEAAFLSGYGFSGTLADLEAFVRLYET